MLKASASLILGSRIAQVGTPVQAKGIWGTWRIGVGKGGFHIWPLAEGEPLTAAEEAQETSNARHATAQTS